MTESTDKYLAMMLEGYEKNLEGVSQFIEQTETQLVGAKKQREDFVESIEELKEVLGIEDEVEDSDTILKLVEDSEESEESIVASD